MCKRDYNKIIGGTKYMLAAPVNKNTHDMIDIERDIIT